MTRQTTGVIRLPSHGGPWAAYGDAIYGSFRGNVAVSLDGWANVKRFTDIGATIGCMYVTDAGTLIVGTSEGEGRVYRITKDGAITIPLVHKQGCYSREWSINGYGNKVVVGAYGLKNAVNPEDNAREVYLSVDDGQTFHLIYQVPALSSTHVHAVAIDAYTDDVWVANGDGSTSRGLRKLAYPTWEPELVGKYQPTAIIARHQRYVLFGTDNGPPQEGVLRYDKETGTLEQVFIFPDQYELPVYSAHYDMGTKTAYFGTAQTLAIVGSEWKAASLWMSKPPYDTWELVEAASGNTYAVYRSIAGTVKSKLIFARDEGSLGLPDVIARGLFLSVPYRS